MAYPRFSTQLVLVTLFVAASQAQNQSPPGRRKPPFIVVPPVNEPVFAASARQDVVVEDAPRRSPVVAVPPPKPPSGKAQDEPDPSIKAQVDSTLDEKCFGCICHAASECKDVNCVLVGPNEYYCGMYHISWAYWVDSGKPDDVKANPFAFEDCLNKKSCAERSIRGYMNKFARDCNGDGLIDCADYTRIHKSGPTGCNGTWIDNTVYWKRFQECWTGGLDFRRKPRPQTGKFRFKFLTGRMSVVDTSGRRSISR